MRNGKAAEGYVGCQTPTPAVLDLIGTGRWTATGLGAEAPSGAV